MKEILKFKDALDSRELVSETTYNCICNTFTEEEIKLFKVVEIDSEYMDGNKLFEHYDLT